MGGFFLLRERPGLETAGQLALWVPFVLVFPLWFFRYSRSPVAGAGVRARTRTKGDEVLTPFAALRLLDALPPPRRPTRSPACPTAACSQGTVRFSGTPPRLEPIAVSRNRDVCGESKESEALVLGAGARRAAAASSWWAGVARGKQPTTTDVVLDSSKCLFVPTSAPPCRASGAA